MAQLVLINGSPGSGKSTIASRLAQDQLLDLALDIDVLKHSLGQWHVDPRASGIHARRLALAVVLAHLGAGYDVYIGQYLARPEFIDELEAAAEGCGATFVELILIVDAQTLAERLDRRRANPDRPEHRANAALVSPEDAPAMVDVIGKLAAQRTSAIAIDASGSLDAVAERVRHAVAGVR